MPETVRAPAAAAGEVGGPGDVSWRTWWSPDPDGPGPRASDNVDPHSD
ncbi:hypothetical protein G3I77_02515 [Streptomyces sp. D2-8]|nr:hypothetical protein [Streptomyces sp. D2-8]MCK8431934.1 hypothetical protein [Streptomyces sp. D2-8]